MSRRGRTVLVAALAAALLAVIGRAIWVSRPDSVTENEFARLDSARLSDGLIAVSWRGGGARRVRLAIERAGGTRYLYELDAGKTTETFPLTEGDGRYTVTVYEQTEGTRYLPRLEQGYDVEMPNPDMPFLLSSRPVSFAAADGVSRLAAELTEGLDEEETLAALTTYVVERMTYDAVWAESLRTGYLPVLEDVLERGGGNCLDLAALLCGLLRAGGIPCRLVVGWAGAEYHAWVSPKIGGAWGHVDPTFLMAGEAEFAEDSNNYRAVYVY